MASVGEWFWCRGCHRAFRAEVWRSDAGRPAASGSLAFTDIQGAVICPFRTCGAMHVTPWHIMCRLYKARFGTPYPEPPVEGRCFEMLAAPRRAGAGGVLRMTGSSAAPEPQEAASR
jgi:hypothetical protein